MLTIYDFPITFVNQLEAACTRHAKRWLGLTKTAPPDLLYVAHNRHGFQLHAISTLFRRLQVGRLHLMKHSADPEMRQQFDREQQRPRSRVLAWDPFDMLELHEATVLNQLHENEQSSRRHGIGFRPAGHAPPPETPAAVRKLIGKETNKAADVLRMQHLQSLVMQGKWANWKLVLPADYSWRRLLHSGISNALLKFAVNAQSRSLPTPDNLRRWHKAPADGLPCKLLGANGQPCGKPYPTLEHILAGCEAALHQGRVTWRHDSVLLALKQHLVPHIHGINSGHVRLNPPRILRFRSEDGSWYNNGNSVAALCPSVLRDFLAGATDWEVLFDLPGRDRYTYTVFPPDIAATSERPDILLMSRSLRIIVCFELTVPSEEKVGYWNDFKGKKYTHLVQEAADNRWQLHVRPIEVGYLGHMARTMEKQLRALAFPHGQRRTIKLQVEEAALRCSHNLFLSRDVATWNKRPLMAVGDRPSTTEAAQPDN
jgi:hypothetical protein